jgi:hypothetical protein
MLHHGLLALATSLLSVPVASASPWNATEYLFVFGDSYTSDGYNISAGINSPDLGYVSVNCPYHCSKLIIGLDVVKWPELG